MREGLFHPVAPTMVNVIQISKIAAMFENVTCTTTTARKRSSTGELEIVLYLAKYVLL